MVEFYLSKVKVEEVAVFQGRADLSLTLPLNLIR